MSKENQAIRDEARNKGVPLWKCALFLHISEPTLIRWLRVPLSSEREAAIRNAIQTIASREEART